MKSFYNSRRCLVICFLISTGLGAQSPCTGTPGSNSIIPASQTICAGSNATLYLVNSYNTTGITYQWQSSAVSMVGPWSNITGANLNLYVTPSLTSTMFYNVIITCTNSGQSINVSTAVYVTSCATPCNGTPTQTNIIPASSTLCPGNVASMSLATSYTNNTGITFQWGSSSSSSGPFTSVPGATLSSFTSSAVTSNTFFNIVVTCTNSNLSYTSQVAISVVSCTYCSGAPPSNTIVPSPHTVCVNSPGTFSLANSYTVSGLQYQWGSSSVSAVGPFSPISGATASTYTSAPLTGTPGTVLWYNVIVTCTNSNQNNAFSQAVTLVTCAVNTTGFEEYSTGGFNIYPNPNSGEVNIRLTGIVQVKLVFTDLLGRNVLSVSVTGGETKVSLKELQNGIYYAHLEGIPSQRRIKIMKE